MFGGSTFNVGDLYQKHMNNKVLTSETNILKQKRFC